MTSPKLGKFCEACQAIPQVGYCSLAGCPNRPSAMPPHHNRHPWCQPGDRQDRVWILRFDDNDRRDMVWLHDDAEEQARAAYAQYAPAWNCYLLATVPADDEAPRLRAALERIARWFGEFPETGQTWPDGSPISYATQFGSNSKRDFMRGIAREALGLPPEAEQP